MTSLHQSSRGVCTPLDDRFKPAIKGSTHSHQWLEQTFHQEEHVLLMMAGLHWSLRRAYSSQRRVQTRHQGECVLPMMTHLYQPLRGVCIPLNGGSFPAARPAPHPQVPATSTWVPVALIAAGAGM
ncbi:hypothetical protein PCASD_10544, partial [Puccinia coronata f. sp. avenae]